jgi:DNA transposition AAA+ family ATPase
MLIAETQNVIRAMSACDSLVDRNRAVPGLGLFYGAAGLGKTTIANELANRHDGITIRCRAQWSARSMTAALCDALRIEPATSPSKSIDAIVDYLRSNPKPMFIDEIDHLFGCPKLLETLRDIHDESGAVMVFIGMAGVDKKFLRYRQTHRRITQSIELDPLDLSDTQLLAKTVCPLKIAEDLLKFLLHESKGNTGYTVVGLSQIETYCAGLDLVRLSDWEEVGKPLFLGSRVV